MDRRPGMNRHKASSNPAPWLLSDVDATALTRKNATWTARSKALTALSACAKAVGENETNALALTSQIRSLASGLASCVSDLRSALVRQSCDAIVVLSTVLGAKLAESAADELLPVLLRRAGTTKLVMRESGAAAAEALLSKGANGVTRVVSLHLCAMVLERSVSAPIRAAAATYLGILLRKACPSLVELGTELDNALRAGCTDADKQVREASRDNLRYLKNVNISRYNTIFSTLNKKVRALVDETFNPNSQTPISSSRTRSALPPLQTPVPPPIPPARRTKVSSEAPKASRSVSSRLTAKPPKPEPVMVTARRSAVKIATENKPPSMNNRVTFVARRRETVEKRLRGNETSNTGTIRGAAILDRAKPDVKQLAPRRSMPVPRVPNHKREPIVPKISRGETVKHLAVGPKQRRPSGPPRRPPKRTQSMMPLTTGHVASITSQIKKTRRPTAIRPSAKNQVKRPPKPPLARRSVVPKTSRPWNLPPPKAAVPSTSRPSVSRPWNLPPPRPVAPKASRSMRQSLLVGSSKTPQIESAYKESVDLTAEPISAKPPTVETLVAKTTRAAKPMNSGRRTAIKTAYVAREGSISMNQSSCELITPLAKIISKTPSKLSDENVNCSDSSPKLLTLNSLCSSSSCGNENADTVVCPDVSRRNSTNGESSASFTKVASTSTKPKLNVVMKESISVSSSRNRLSTVMNGRVSESTATCSTHSSRRATARVANITEANTANSLMRVLDYDASGAIEISGIFTESTAQKLSSGEAGANTRKSRISFLLGDDRTPKPSPSDTLRRQSSTLSETGDNNQVQVRVLGTDWLQMEDGSVQHTPGEHPSAVSISKSRSVFFKKETSSFKANAPNRLPALSLPKRRSDAVNQRENGIPVNLNIKSEVSTTTSIEKQNSGARGEKSRIASTEFVDTENGSRGKMAVPRKSLASCVRQFGRDLTTTPNVRNSIIVQNQKQEKASWKDNKKETKLVGDAVEEAKNAHDEGWEERIEALAKMTKAFQSVKGAKVEAVERLVDELARYIDDPHVRVVSCALDAVFDLLLDTDMKKLYTVLDRRTALLSNIVSRLSDKREQARLAAERALQSFNALFDGVQQLALLARIHDRSQSKGRLGNEAKCMLGVLERTREMTASSRTLEALVEVAAITSKHRRDTVRRTGLELAEAVQSRFDGESIAMACARREVSLE